MTCLVSSNLHFCTFGQIFDRSAERFLKRQCNSRNIEREISGGIRLTILHFTIPSLLEIAMKHVLKDLRKKRPTALQTSGSDVACSFFLSWFSKADAAACCARIQLSPLTIRRASLLR